MYACSNAYHQEGMLSSHFVDKKERMWFIVYMEDKNELKMLSARLPAKQVKALKVMAAVTERTVAALLEEAIEDLLQKHKPASK